MGALFDIETCVPYDKKSPVEACFAQRKMAAAAATLQRECAPSAHVFSRARDGHTHLTVRVAGRDHYEGLGESVRAGTVI